MHLCPLGARALPSCTISHVRSRLGQAAASVFQNEFGKTSAPVTPLHVPEEETGAEEKAASRDFVRQCQGVALKGWFPAGSVFAAGDGDGDEFNSPWRGEGNRGRQVCNEKSGDESRDAQGRSRSLPGDLLP